MTIALPKGDFLVTAGFAAIAGAGVASSFTVFANSSTWYLVLVAVITLGVYPPSCGLAIATAQKCCALSHQRIVRPFRRVGYRRAALFRFTSHLGHLRPHHILWWRGICGILRRLDSEAVPSPVTGK